MKTFSLLRVALGLLFLFTAMVAQAQTPAPAAPVLPGYWNTETNLTTRDYTIVRFYDGQDQLVYEERLPSLLLDLTRNTGCCRRAKRHLTLALQAALRGPAADQPTDRLARQFGADRRVQRAYAVR